MTKLVNLSQVPDIPNPTDEPEPTQHTWQPANLIQLAADGGVVVTREGCWT